MLFSFPTKGFLGTGATFEADLNLIVQLFMGLALHAGALLARQKRYRAHGICQTPVLSLNLLMIGLVMWPSFRQQVTPAISKVLDKWYYGAAAMHAVLGITAGILGTYIVFVAGTNALPEWLRFKHWKRWMRTELGDRSAQWSGDVLRMVRRAVPVTRATGGHCASRSADC